MLHCIASSSSTPLMAVFSFKLMMLCLYSLLLPEAQVKQCNRCWKYILGKGDKLNDILFLSHYTLFTTHCCYYKVNFTRLSSKHAMGCLPTLVNVFPSPVPPFLFTQQELHTRPEMGSPRCLKHENLNLNLQSC